MSVREDLAFVSADSLVLKLAEEIADQLRQSLLKNGQASLVVSGGSTPVPLFRALSQTSLDWKNVWVTLADERWVLPSHQASNEALVRKHLIANGASEARFVGLWNAADTPVSGLALSQKSLEGLPQPIDVVVLGMGEDGHTASLFPEAHELQAALNAAEGVLCLPITPPEAPHARMTLTKPALLNSRRLFLHITGQVKRDVFDVAQGSEEVAEMPIRAFIHQTDVPLDVYWAP